MKLKTLALLGSLCLPMFTSSFVSAQEDNDVVNVDINFDVVHRVGGISEFDRSKYITLHATHAEPDWDLGTNAVGDLRKDLLSGYDVYLGRDTGAVSWMLSQVAEDPERPGYASPEDLKRWADIIKTEYAERTDLHRYEARNDLIVGGQLHPFWPDGTLTGQGWALSTEDSEQAPLGTATGDYMGHWLEAFFGEGGTTGEPLPKWVEVINEPVWGLVDDEKTSTPEEIFAFHNAVANAIREFNPDIMIGGYTAAFPEFEENNFRRWEERWKSFIDIAGENMDFFSLHFYDFPTQGQERYRKGSNIEATLDMLEVYSHLSLGEIKPFLISEYGSQLHDLYNQPWSPYRDWLILKAVNSMLMQFMERPDVILKTIPFITLKAEWGRLSENVPYYWRLMRRAGEPESNTGDWVYTDLIKFYELWAEVKGIRVDSFASDPDIQVDAYVDGNKAHVILNSLEFEEKTITLNRFGIEDNAVTDVTIQHLYLLDNNPVLETGSFTEVPKHLTLSAEATLILTYTYEDPINLNHSSIEKKFYPNTYLERINPDQARTYTFEDVNVGTYGEAVLRLGLSRSHYVSFQPEIKINGINIQVPEDFRGYDQVPRGRFFGVLEIPVPYELLEVDNEVVIEFPDSTGFISTVILQTFAFSRNMARSP